MKKRIPVRLVVEPWDFKCFFWRPPELEDSFVGSSVFEIKFLAPDEQRLCLRVMCNKNRASLVAVLLLFCSPPAIFRRVVSVVISSVYFCTRKRLVSHVGNEVSESVASRPRIANLNSSPAVIFVVFVVFVQAPSLHIPPAQILSRLAFPVCRLCLGEKLLVETPTTPCVSSLELRSSCSYDSSALALAYPRIKSDVVQNGKSIKLPFCNVLASDSLRDFVRDLSWVACF